MPTEPSADLALGIDLGGSNLRLALVDRDHRLVALRRQPLTNRQPQAVLAQMLAACQHLKLSLPLNMPVGIGLAAQVWLHSGVVAVAPNLNWFDVPFGDLAARSLGCRVRLINDLNAIALGESICGEPEPNMMVVFVGTGVGMGAVVDGRIIEGADGLATELGHIKIASVETGRLCGCGQRGCLEAYTSGQHLPALLQAQPAAQPQLQSAADIEVAAVAGDAAAQRLWDEIGHLLGRGIGAAITLFNPRKLVLGGGVLLSAPSLKDRVCQQITAYTARPAQQNLTIMTSRLGDEAAMIGAACAARQLQLTADQG